LINDRPVSVDLPLPETSIDEVIDPLGPTSMATLQEFYDPSKTDLVFSRSGNISPKFYRILRLAASVAYGRKNPNGLVLHDASHTVTTQLLESNVGPKTVQEWMGWSDKALFFIIGTRLRKHVKRQDVRWKNWPVDRGRKCVIDSIA
jgi:integrase